MEAEAADPAAVQKFNSWSTGPHRRRTDGLTNDRQTDRSRQIQVDRQTDRHGQTDRQTDRVCERESEWERR